MVVDVGAGVEEEASDACGLMLSVYSGPSSTAKGIVFACNDLKKPLL